MALLNRHSRLTIDPCILKSAKDILKFAHEVARKSDHTTSDLLITAVWCCMNCSCNPSNNKDRNEQTCDHSKSKRPVSKTDHGISGSRKEKTPDQAASANNTDTKKALHEKPKPSLANSIKNPTEKEQSSQKQPTATASKSMLSSTNNYHERTAKSDQAENVVALMDDMSYKQISAEKDASVKKLPIKEKNEGPESCERKQLNNGNVAEENDTAIIVLDDLEDETDLIKTPTDGLTETNDKESLSKSGIEIENNDLKNQVDNVHDEFDIFEMDCDEIDEDLQSDDETIEKLKDLNESDDPTKQSDKEMSDTEEITIISDDEDTKADECSSGKANEQKDKHYKERDQANCKANNSPPDNSNMTKKKEVESEVINLDSDSEPENDDNSLKKISEENKTSVANSDGQVKTEPESDTQTMEGFQSTSLGNQAVDNNFDQSNLVKTEPVEPVIATDVHTQVADMTGENPENTTSEYINRENSELVSMGQSASQTESTQSMEFGPSVMGLVPNHAVHSRPPSQTITATTITFFSQGPSWGSVTQEQEMPCFVQTNQAVITNMDEVPPVKKRLLDFDKKWHMAPKTDMHQDRYLARPGGVEGNSIESVEERQRKLATRKSVSDWMAPGHYTSISDASIPTVQIENLVNLDGDVSDVDNDESDRESDDSEKETARRSKQKKTLKVKRKETQSASSKGKAQGIEQEEMKVKRGRGRPKGSFSKHRGIGRGRGRGRGQTRSSSSPGSPVKSPGSMHKKKIGFYVVRVGASEYARGRGRGGVRGRGRGSTKHDGGTPSPNSKPVTRTSLVGLTGSKRGRKVKKRY